MLMALSVAGLLVACSSGASPSVTPAAVSSPTATPTATANRTPTPSPVVTPVPTPVVAPSPTPVATATAECPADPRPSTLAALDIASRLSCYGSTPLTFGAVVVPKADAPIADGWPQVPARFTQISLPEYGPLFLVDIGKEFDSETSLALYVADESRIPWDFVVNFRGVPTNASPSSVLLQGGLSVTGHFDDPASADCRGRPAVDEGGWPEITDEQMVEWCRGTFIVTRIWNPSG